MFCFDMRLLYTPSIKINHIPILKTPDASFLDLENPPNKMRLFSCIWAGTALPLNRRRNNEENFNKI